MLTYGWRLFLTVASLGDIIFHGSIASIAPIASIVSIAPIIPYRKSSWLSVLAGGTAGIYGCRSGGGPPVGERCF